MILILSGIGLGAQAQVPPPYLKAATFYVSVDKWADFWINDIPIIENQPRTVYLTGAQKVKALPASLCLFGKENILAIEVDDNSRPKGQNDNYVGLAYILQLIFSDGTRRILTSNEADEHRAYYIQDFMAGRPAGWQRFDFEDGSWGVAQSAGNFIPGLATVTRYVGESPVSFLSAVSSSPRAQKAGERHLFRRKFFLNISSNPECLKPIAQARVRPPKLFKPAPAIVQPSPTPRVMFTPTPTAAIDRIDPLLVRRPDQRHQKVPDRSTMVPTSTSWILPAQDSEPALTSTPTPILISVEPPAQLPASVPTVVPSFTMTPSLGSGQTIVFGAPPANIYVNFADGPGVYRLEVFDKSGDHWKTFFEKKVVTQGDDWAEWDGRNETGLEAPAGEYYVVFSRNGKELKRITVIKSVGNQ